MTKALWYTSLDHGSLATVLHHAAQAQATIVCVRTTSGVLPAAIRMFNQNGIQVYAWRWPAVVQQQYQAPHYYALDEANYVVNSLLPAGLAGYIVDPESDQRRIYDNWNSSTHAQLARDFCHTIKSAAPANFHFGVTSGCQYPTNHAQIPWAEFVAAADALYPQTYWRDAANGAIHGGTPASSHSLGMASWQTIANGKPLIAMAGDLDSITATEIAQYGALVAGRQPVAHFYADSVATSPAVLAAIAAL